MIRKLILLIIFLNPILLFCQFNKGKAYRNSADFINDKPCYQTNFRYVKIKSAKANGAFKVKSDDLAISGNEIKYGIWIISDGEYLYLNGTRNGCTDGYIKLKKGSRYYYFKAEPMLSNDQQARINNSSILFGAIGGTITAATLEKETSGKEHHVLDLIAGKTYYLTKNYMRSLLADYPSLLEEFDKTENNSDIEVLKAYLDKINQRF